MNGCFKIHFMAVNTLAHSHARVGILICYLEGKERQETICHNMNTHGAKTT